MFCFLSIATISYYFLLKLLFYRIKSNKLLITLVMSYFFLIAGFLNQDKVFCEF